MKALIYTIILLLTTSIYSISKDANTAVDCCLTNKEIIIGKWYYKQDKKIIDISFKWDGRMYLTDQLYTESRGIIKSQYTGEWNIVDDTLTMLIEGNTIRYKITFDGINSFSLILFDTKTTYIRVW